MMNEGSENIKNNNNFDLEVSKDSDKLIIYLIQRFKNLFMWINSDIYEK